MAETNHYDYEAQKHLEKYLLTIYHQVKEFSSISILLFV